MKKLFIIVSFSFALLCNAGLISEGATNNANIIYEGNIITKVESIIADETTQSTEQEVYQVSVELNYGGFSLSKDDDFIEHDVDNYLLMVKDAGRNHHMDLNNHYITELGLEGKTNIRSSKYTPFIYYSEDMTYEELLPSLEVLSQNDVIDNIYVTKANKSDLEDVKTESYTPYSYVNVDTIVNNGTYDGSGVVVGVLDSGIIDKDNKNFVGQDLVIRDEWWYAEKESAHATRVASFISGKYGIAPNAKTLSVEYNGPDMQGEIEWMMDKNVNIVNISIADSSLNDGKYSSNAKYIDYITRKYWITFVGSAGNEGKEDGLITSPKTGANIITVGAAKNRYHVSDISSYHYVDEFFDKPTLIAPGENVKLPDGSSGYYTGTSYSSGIVAGSVALLMDKSSSLKSYPEKVMSILTATADMDTLSVYYNDYEDSNLEVKAGAGMLDVEEALASIYKTYSFTVSDNSKAFEDVYTKSVYLKTGDTLRVSAAWLKNVDKTSVGYDVQETTDYDLKLDGPDGLWIESAGSFDNNIELIEYKATETGYHKIRIYQFGDKLTNMTEYGSVTYTIN